MKPLSTLLLGALILCAPPASGQKNNNSDFDPYSATIEANISTPSVPSKQSESVANAMGPLLRTLRKAGYTVSAVRNGEVVLVTIPCSELFAPNSTELKPGATAKLSPLRPFAGLQENYKVIIAVHSDNTGDELYAERLTADRANAVDEYFYQASGNQETGFIPYGLGADEPVAPNTGIANRARNRRVEIYFVPTKEFIDNSRKNR